MSWFSEFLHSPLDYIRRQPLKALSLLAAPVAAIAAPFAAPAIASGLGSLGSAVGGALGLGGAGAAGGAAAGGDLAALLGSTAGAGLEGADLATLLGGSALSGGEGFSALGFAPEVAGGFGNPLATGLAATSDALGSGAFNVAGANALAPGGLSIESLIAQPLGDLSSAATGVADTALGLDPTAAAFGGAAGDGGVGLGGLVGDVGSIGTSVASPAGDAVGIGTTAATEGGPFSIATGGAGSTNWWDKFVTAAANDPLKTAGLGLNLGLLGYNVAQGQSLSPAEKRMQEIANQEQATGAELQRYLRQGKLPPGLQTGLDEATQAAKARAINNAARSGMPTDPAQNSALAQDLASIDRNAADMVAKIGQQLLDSGIRASGVSANLLNSLANIDLRQSQATGQAIANLAAALSGTGRPVTARAA